MTEKEFLEKIIAQLSLDLKEARDTADEAAGLGVVEAVAYCKGLEHAVEFLCNLFHSL